MVERKYTVGNDRALFLFSKGYCYFPTCPVRVFRQVGDDMFTQVQRAHIHGFDSKKPRWKPLPEHQLNSHRNLMLMCQPHHQAIDADEKRYPAELLLGWKRDREGKQMDALHGLEGLTDKDFNRIVADSVIAAKTEILGAIGDLSDKHEDIAATLRELVDNSGRQPELDRDSVDALAEASNKLWQMNFGEHASLLLRAAETLDDLNLNVPDPNDIRQIGYEINSIDQTVEQWKNAAPDPTPLERAAQRLEDAKSNLAEHTLGEYVDKERWKDYFRYGFIVGGVLTAAIAILFGVLIANGTSG